MQNIPISGLYMFFYGGFIFFLLGLAAGIWLNAYAKKNIKKMIIGSIVICLLTLLFALFYYTNAIEILKYPLREV